MTADSELFVTEAIRDVLYEELDIDVDIEVPDNWKDIWDESIFPEEGESNILKDGEIIGRIWWTVDFYVEDDGHARWVAARPDEISVTIDRGYIIGYREGVKASKRKAYDNWNSAIDRFIGSGEV